MGPVRRSGVRVEGGIHDEHLTVVMEELPAAVEQTVQIRKVLDARREEDEMETLSVKCSRPWIPMDPGDRPTVECTCCLREFGFTRVQPRHMVACR